LAIEHNTAAVMTADEVRASVASNVCAVCGKYKRTGAAFCATDFAALSLPQRLGVTDQSTSYFADAFRSALRHLQLNVERKRSLAESGWHYRSDEELVAAGFTFSEHTRCSVPVPNRRPYECGKRISIYITPRREDGSRKRMALDAQTLQPHRPHCADPDYFERRRAEKEQQKKSKRVQTSAGRATKRGRR
jgi:hypothetical protein